MTKEKLTPAQAYAYGLHAPERLVGTNYEPRDSSILERSLAGVARAVLPIDSLLSETAGELLQGLGDIEPAMTSPLRYEVVKGKALYAAKIAGITAAIFAALSS